MASLFCSGSDDFGLDDFDDEDFLSVVEGIERSATESSHVNCEPAPVCLRPIPKTTTEDSAAGRESRHTKSLLVQQAAIAERCLESPETVSAPAAPQDMDDEELMSLCSELEDQASREQCRAPQPHPNQTLPKNGKDLKSSSFQLRPPRSNPDMRPRHCLSDITAQSQHTHVNANFPSSHLAGGAFHSPEPTAKRPCLRPGVEPQTVTPGRGGTFSSCSNSTYPRSSLSPGANIWQTGPANAPPAAKTPLASPGPHPPSTLQTPVVTNHLIQLMTAANKTPKNLPWETPPPKERRFPGPAGLLPQQGSCRRLDEILVSTPRLPNHGARAKLHSKEGASSQQPAEEQFIRGPWATMKAELLLDENDPTCFLRSYSVVMVLRKAALRQLPKNKVPTMAVALKVLTLANGDASAVFRDPTGDIQGTIHHLLLEERESELKIGSVLLLQQVGVFSPSHRNHYLNVTPSNVVKIYPPLEEGVNTRVSAPDSEVDMSIPRTRSPLHPSSSTPWTSHPPLSGTSHVEVPHPPLSRPSSKSPHPAGPPTSSNTTLPRITQPTTSHLSFSTKQPEGQQTDWDLDDLDSLLCDLPEDM
ncbi:hypothetical protein GDO78_004545 [Eleutherodactylus coqui]|uniref:Homologous recombination OB-fold protein OB-fold domain-containing protein n=2 Tax=Eleutherodactylus coqui TaxID=57060 RepID=A0A8J6ES36_ELECQ|nr:hypothetical protein GDO78_004545 [Eleutherodactylus coqui]